MKNKHYIILIAATLLSGFVFIYCYLNYNDGKSDFFKSILTVSYYVTILFFALLVIIPIVIELLKKPESKIKPSNTCGDCFYFIKSNDKTTCFLHNAHTESTTHKCKDYEFEPDKYKNNTNKPNHIK